jgi:hypothetical protein
MFQPLPFQSVSEAVESFVADIHPQAPCRVEAKVASHDGMPLLCAVEAALGAALARPATHELVWLSGAAKAGAHILRLQAYGPDNELLAEALHEFEA